MDRVKLGTSDSWDTGCKGLREAPLTVETQQWHAGWTVEDGVTVWEWTCRGHSGQGLVLAALLVNPTLVLVIYTRVVQEVVITEWPALASCDAWNTVWVRSGLKLALYYNLVRKIKECILHELQIIINFLSYVIQHMTLWHFLMLFDKLFDKWYAFPKLPVLWCLINRIINILPEHNCVAVDCEVRCEWML